MVHFSYAQKPIIRAWTPSANAENPPPGSSGLTSGVRWHYRVIIGGIPDPTMKLQKPLLAAAAFAVVAVLSGSPAIAAMYKWVDENGHVNYGDTPPAGVKAERMVTNAPPADPAAVRDLATKDAEIRKRMQQRTDDDAKVQKDRVADNLRLTQCQQAIGRVRTLRQDQNVYRYDEKGDKVFLDAAARENSIAENQKLMRDLGCTPAIQP
jgi:Domain of unknown function (DUF4124)